MLGWTPPASLHALPMPAIKPQLADYPSCIIITTQLHYPAPGYKVRKLNYFSGICGLLGTRCTK